MRTRLETGTPGTLRRTRAWRDPAVETTRLKMARHLRGAIRHIVRLKCADLLTLGAEAR